MTNISEENLIILCNLMSKDRLYTNGNKLEIHNNSKYWLPFMYKPCVNELELTKVLKTTILNNLVFIEIHVNNQSFTNSFTVRKIQLKKSIENLKEYNKVNNLNSLGKFLINIDKILSNLDKSENDYQYSKITDKKNKIEDITEHLETKEKNITSNIEDENENKNNIDSNNEPEDKESTYNYLNNLLANLWF